MPEKIRVLLTGGGTGGHIYPAIVIADEIRRLKPNASILFVGTKRGLESKVLPPLGYELKFIDVNYFIRRLTLKNFSIAYKALASIFAAKRIIREFNPQVVVGTGGYVSGPVVFAATQLKVPTLIHEQNAFPGLTTRLLAKRVTQVAVSHAQVVKRLKSGTAVVVTGHPVRRDFFSADPGDYLQQLGLTAAQPLVIVVGGSGGALKLNQITLAAAPDILANPEVVLVHVTGSRYYPRVKDELASMGLNPELAGRYKLIEYLDDMPGAMKACALMVARAGGMTHELTATGCPSILVPSPNVTDDHQLHNARAMAAAGAARVVEESELTAASLAREIGTLLGDSEARTKMAAAAKHLGKPEAGSRLASMAIALAKKIN